MSKGYFASQDSEVTASAVLAKVTYWADALTTTNYLDKCRNSWKCYYGMYFQDNSHGHTLNFTGEQGELTQIAINHFQNIGKHLLNNTTANRPALEALATNSDAKSISQAILANDLLDYYMTEKRLEEYLRRCAEYAIVFGEGYVKVEWDSTQGEAYEFNEELNTYIYEGDVKFTNLSIFDVIRDTSREDQDHDWIVVRTYKNRYDLIAKYPDFKEVLEGIPSKDDSRQTIINASIYGDETDQIPVFEFFHKRTDSMQDGRYMIIVSQDGVLHDGPLPYRQIPVYRMSPGDVIGTPFGYTPMFDLIPIQEAVNGLYSTIMTNQNAFGVQNIMMPRGSNISANQMDGGLNLIEYDSALGKPEALNLTKTPPEIFNFIDKLESKMETLSGINSVARGNPEASLRSGNALALIQAQAIQFSTGLQQSYIRLTEDVGTAIIKLLQDYATTPRVATIAGKSKRSYVKQFKGEDIKAVNRVKVKVSNPLAKTAAGRSEIANNLLQMGLIKNPQQYFTVLQTGALDVMMEGDQAELLSIKTENEYLADAKQVPVIDTDNHAMHIQEHKAVIADPEMRMQPDVVQTVLEHIQMHIEALKTVSPELLQILGQQPLAPAAPPPGAPPAPGGDVKAAPEGSTEVVQQPLPVGVQEAQQIAQPNMPTPPAPFESAPLTPQANAEQLINQG